MAHAVSAHDGVVGKQQVECPAATLTAYAGGSMTGKARHADISTWRYGFSKRVC